MSFYLTNPPKKTQVYNQPYKAVIESPLAKNKEIEWADSWDLCICIESWENSIQPTYPRYDM